MASASNADEQAKSFNSTAAYLEWLSIQIMEGHTSNNKTSESYLRQHLAPDFEMVNETVHECPLLPATNLEDHLLQTKRFKAEHPYWKVECTNVTAKFTKGSNNAEVWVTMRGCDTGGDLMFNRESVSWLHWRKSVSNGVWLCYRHSGMRGGGDQLAFI